MYRTIVAVDVEKFGSRSPEDQRRMRAGLDSVLRDAFEHCGIPWDESDHEHFGDGLLILTPSYVPYGRFVECLPNELAGRLREHNAQAAASGARMRLRVAMHRGDVHHDSQGFSSSAVVLAIRLLDALPLKKALADSHGTLALITSSEFFHDVVVSRRAASPFLYQRVTVSKKETLTYGWIYLPDNVPASTPKASSPQPAPARSRTALAPVNFRYLSLMVLTTVAVAASVWLALNLDVFQRGITNGYGLVVLAPLGALLLIFTVGKLLVLFDVDIPSRSVSVARRALRVLGLAPPIAMSLDEEADRVWTDVEESFDQALRELEVVLDHHDRVARRMRSPR